MKIEFKNVSFHYPGDSNVLNDVSFVIESDKMTSIIGPNGSGKSTIAKLIMGLIEPDSGHIYINDDLLTKDNVYSIRQNMGIIFQNPDNQFVGVTVLDDIAFGLENRQIPRNEMLSLIHHYAQMVKMDRFLESNPENLSGGQKQRVAIAGVLAMNPETIIFDEATSMLDPIGVKEINETMKMLKKTAKKTIISITHNIEEVLYSEHIIVINNGVIVYTGSPKEVLSNVKLLETAKLDTIDTIKLINKLENIDESIKELLWELTFKM